MLQGNREIKQLPGVAVKRRVSRNYPFCDEAFTPSVARAQASADPETRRKATEAAMALAHDRAMGVFLYESIAFIGLGPRVQTFATDFAFIRYEKLRIAP